MPITYNRSATPTPNLETRSSSPSLNPITFTRQVHQMVDSSSLPPSPLVTRPKNLAPSPYPRSLSKLSPVLVLTPAARVVPRVKSQPEKWFWWGFLAFPIWIYGASFLVPRKGRASEEVSEVDLEGAPRSDGFESTPSQGISRFITPSMPFATAAEKADSVEGKDPETPRPTVTFHLPTTFHSTTYQKNSQTAQEPDGESYPPAANLTPVLSRQIEKRWAMANLYALLLFCGIAGLVGVLVYMIHDHSPGSRSGSAMATGDANQG